MAKHAAWWSRRTALAGVTLAGLLGGLAIGPVPSASAGSADSGATSRSLAVQAAVAADQALGDDATMAVLRSYDRGYGALQVIEALFGSELEADGTIVDGSTPEAPFRPATNVVTASNTPQVEQGIADVTKRLNKLVDLAGRVERMDVDDDALVALLTTALMVEGYSPEQIIVDGFMGKGVALDGKAGAWKGVKLVDEQGKPIKPAGVTESEEQQEAAGLLDQFVDEVVEAVAAIDPRVGATTKLAGRTPKLDIEVDLTDSDGDRTTIRATGIVGHPADKSLKRYLTGKAIGEVELEGTCGPASGNFAFTGRGPVTLGLSGASGSGSVTVNLAPIAVDVSGNALPETCLFEWDEIGQIVQALRFGPIQLPLDDDGLPRPGATKAPVQASIGDLAGTMVIDVRG